MDLVHPPDKI